MLKKIKDFIIFILIIFVFIIFIGSSNKNYSQELSVSDKNMASLQFEKLYIKSQSIGQTLSEISLYYSIPFSLETALNDDEYLIYNIDFKGGSLKELLDLVIGKTNQYSWEIKDGIVRVF